MRIDKVRVRLGVWSVPLVFGGIGIIVLGAFLKSVPIIVLGLAPYGIGTWFGE